MSCPRSIMRVQISKAWPSWRPWNAPRRMRSRSRDTEPLASSSRTSSTGCRSGQCLLRWRADLAGVSIRDRLASCRGMRGDFFDAMAADYEVLEPWYEHLYARLHALLRDALPRPPPRRVAARARRRLRAPDSRRRVLQRAGLRGARPRPRAEAAARRARSPPDARAGAGRRGGAAVSRWPLRRGDLLRQHAQLRRRPAAALAELARVLAPGGRLLLECEGRWSLDLAWAWLSGVLGDRWGYALTPADVWRAVSTPSDRECRLRYPGYGSLRLFGVGELTRLLAAAELTRSACGVSTGSRTSFPSTGPAPACGSASHVGAVYRALCRVDAALVRAAAGEPPREQPRRPRGQAALTPRMVDSWRRSRL